MLPVGWLVLAVVVAALVSMWVTFTLTRLDRLHARVDAARATLDAQLVRRAAALLEAAEAAGGTGDAPGCGTGGLSDADRAGYEATARAALAPARPDRREGLENAVGRGVTRLLASLEAGPVTGFAGTSVHDQSETAQKARLPDALGELREAAARVPVARRLYNDAVRDTRALRARRMPRLLRLAGRVELPQFFDIDDTPPPDGPARTAGSAAEAEPTSATEEAR